MARELNGARKEFVPLENRQNVPRPLKLWLGLLYILIVALGSYLGSRDWVGVEGGHYFASRKNILNQLFVKRGWLWFSLIFWYSYFARTVKPTLRAAVLRFGVATLWWLLFTQWFFGAPVMDRVFTSTGGVCSVDPVALGVPAVASRTHTVVQAATEAATADKVMGRISRGAESALQKIPVSSSKCRGTGGIWQGGHDPSGHVFLIVHSSIVLWMEILPEILSRYKVGVSQARATKVPLALLSLWGFMLLMTSIYFHSFSEKLSGLLSGLVEAYIVYLWGETQSWGKMFEVHFEEDPAQVRAEENEHLVAQPAEIIVD